ncbi:MAG TPA: ParB/RepB/Spo0J family partition protein [Thermaerobacter sp.]
MQAPRRLGSGLGDLVRSPDPAAKESTRLIPIFLIRTNPTQPRRRFEGIEELAESIRQHGLLQPLVVTLDPETGGYLLVAGERRFRAAQAAGLTEVPCVVRQLSAQETALLAMVENLQRDDLTPMEEARGYAALRDQHGLTQEDIARHVGKSRSRIANLLRLLQLPAEVQEMLEQGRLTVGHVLPLLALEDPEAITGLARQIEARQMTARQVERAVRRLREGKREAAAAGEPVASGQESEEWRQIGERLQGAGQRLGAAVRLERQGRRWRLVVEGEGMDALRRWADRLDPPE